MRGDRKSQEQEQFPYNTVFNEFKQGSNIMITREMFEDAIKDLEDDSFLISFGGKVIRLC